MSEFRDYFEDHLMALLHKEARALYPEAYNDNARATFVETALEEIAEILVSNFRCGTDLLRPRRKK